MILICSWRLFIVLGRSEEFEGTSLKVWIFLQEFLILISKIKI